VIPIDSAKPLMNPRWEEFSVLIALKKMRPSEAYRKAYGKGEDHNIWGEGSKLKSRPEVRARIEALLAERASRAQGRIEIADDFVLGEVLEVIKAAKEEGKLAQVLKALEMLGKHKNLWNGVTEEKDYSGMDDNALREEARDLGVALESFGEGSEADRDSEGAEESEAPELPPVSETG